MTSLRTALLAIALLLLPVACTDSGGGDTATEPNPTPRVKAPPAAKPPPKVVAPEKPLVLPDPPVPGEIEAALITVAALKTLAEDQDYRKIYDEQLHSIGREKTSYDRFLSVFEGGVGSRMAVLCDAIQQAQEAGGIQSGALIFKRYPNHKVPGSIALQVPSRQGDRDWAYRLVMAPDPVELKFFDID
ncbi:MAG: hypothetical protein GY715_15480 [Planctomycetes bacterium]|nr:hypothetical protein [Planctomycetota bacterium]